MCIRDRGERIGSSWRASLSLAQERSFSQESQPKPEIAKDVSSLVTCKTLASNFEIASAQFSLTAMLLTNASSNSIGEGKYWNTPSVAAKIRNGGVSTITFR